MSGNKTYTKQPGGKEIWVCKNVDAGLYIYTLGDSINDVLVVQTEKDFAVTDEVKIWTALITGSLGLAKSNNFENVKLRY